ncbi:MAG: HD-GYP domain-containing protein [Candidatus Omnitrophota bacterium]|nr:HD-GYP domain-containing protein [Candidatus Omnitrophota bacterium]
MQEDFAKYKNIFEKNSTFKLYTLFILFLLIFFQFLSMVYKFKIVPDAFSISIAFICICYLWLAEMSDRNQLQTINLELMLTQNLIKESHVDTIMALVLSQEAKDRYTYGHSERVTKYSVAIAREMGLMELDIEIIERSGKLHDIGKIGISDDVLFAEGNLDEEKMNIIRTHPAKGVNILEPLKFLDREKDIIRHHHERYDGKGYPDGIKGEQISIGARIMAVADAFDAMRSNRPYKQNLSKAEIISELLNNSGTQFDPKIVNTFLKIMDRFYA